MPVITRYNEPLELVESTWIGVITQQELAETNEEHTRLHIDYGVQSFLNDLSSIEKLSLSINDLFQLPSKKYDESSASRMIRIALIKPSIPDAEDLLTFYETACLNRGWNVQIFVEHSSAFEWLTQKRST